MYEICKKIKINPQKLYNGCIFMAVAHAVTVGEYPELNYQHSWDSINYCMNNSQGCRGTITFGKKYIIAVFQDTSVKTPYQNAMNFFKDAPEAIVELAKSETFQYVLENIDGEIIKNGAHILAVQLMEIQEALRACDDYYGLTDGQMDLILSLSKQRSQTDFSMPIILEKTDVLYGDMSEIRVSMGELNIKLEE